MSLMRLNALVMSKIVPFNFGMDYDSWLKFYDANHEKMPGLCPDDPRTWTQEEINEVNQRAKEENELVDRMMALPKEEFYAELERLGKQHDGD